MTDLMSRAHLDMTNIEPLLDDVEALDPVLADELREAIQEAGDALQRIAQDALYEAEESMTAAARR